jgi:lactate dehydrogenase-like 2-hydroxyacid dehydrogenase
MKESLKLLEKLKKEEKSQPLLWRARFTKEALISIAETTIKNISDFAAGHENENILRPANVLKASGKDKQ